MEDRMNGLQSLSNDLTAAVERGARSLFGVNGRARLGSTGVHWRQGLVVTADHTVQVDEEVAITRPDGRSLAARVAGRDPTIDIAVLKVDAPGVEVADVADSDAVRVGHIVLALGSGPRASWGVVSSIGEGRRARSAAGDLFHLDLTLYPGFSGGPLVDVQGRVVGINTSGSSRHWQLAIPAAAAGLSIGDVIVSLGATRITDPTDLKSALRPDKVGESITASVLRGGEPRDLQVTAGGRPRRF